MNTLTNIASNEYFPAAMVLLAVILFWTIALLGGLSLLSGHQPPLATLGWLLFVYTTAVLSPIAGVLAAADLLRRWLRNRKAARTNASASEPSRP